MESHLELKVSDILNAMSLLADYMQRVLYDGGVYRETGRGISLGCPLSPLMAALYLKPIDDAMDELDLFYARFMDDWVILTPTRWKLRRNAVRRNELKALCFVLSGLQPGQMG